MDSDYKRLCGEIWDALGVPPNQQKGEPTETIKASITAARKVVEVFSNKDKPGWAPMQLRDAVAKLMYVLH